MSTSGEVWISAADGLETHYKEWADARRHLESAEVEAARLFASAKLDIKCERRQQAIANASEALERFQQVGHRRAAADSIRLIVHAYALANERAKASQLIEDHLSICKVRRDKLTEAKLLLSSAEIDAENWEEGYRDWALWSATEARDIFWAEGEKIMEAVALLVMTGIHLKRAGWDTSHEDALQEAEDCAQKAHKIITGCADKRGKASSLHWLAQVYGQCSEHDLEVVPPTEESACHYCDERTVMSRAVDLLKEAGDDILAARELQYLADWYLENNEGVQASPLAQEAVDLLRKEDVAASLETACVITLFNARIWTWMLPEAVQLANSMLKKLVSRNEKKLQADLLLLMVQGYAQYAEDGPEGPVPEEALALLERAIQIVKDIGDKAWEAELLGMASELYLRNRRMEKVCNCAMRALAIPQNGTRGVPLRSLANAYREERKLEKAAEVAKEAVEFYQWTEERDLEAASLMIQSDICFMRGEKNDALDCASQAQTIFHQLRHRESEGKALKAMSQILTAQKDYERALLKAEKALSIFRRTADKANEVHALNLTAHNHVLLLVQMHDGPPSVRQAFNFAQGIARASRTVEESIFTAEAWGDKRSHASALSAAAHFDVYEKRFEDALDKASQAEDLFRQLADLKSEASIMVFKGRILGMSGHIHEAVETISTALAVFTDAGDAEGQAVAQHALQSLEDTQFDDNLTLFDDAIPPVSSAPATQEPKDDAADAQIEKKVREKIQEVTRAMVGAIEEVDADQPLMELGVTSMAAIRYREKIANEFDGIRFPATLVFDYPTVRGITQLIIGN